MKKKSLGETVRRAVIGIVLADVISALIYLFLNAILRAVFYGDKYGDRNFTPDYTPILICLFFIFQIAFWISYTCRTSADFKVIREDSFSWKGDLRETMTAEGRVLMIVTAVLAVILEIAFLFENTASVAVRHALTPIFSIAGVTGLVNIPILRTLIAYTLTVAAMIAQLVWQHSRDFKKWSRPQG